MRSSWKARRLHSLKEGKLGLDDCGNSFSLREPLSSKLVRPFSFSSLSLSRLILSFPETPFRSESVVFFNGGVRLNGGAKREICVS